MMLIYEFDISYTNYSFTTHFVIADSEDEAQEILKQCLIENEKEVIEGWNNYLNSRKDMSEDEKTKSLKERLDKEMSWQDQYESLQFIDSYEIEKGYVTYVSCEG